MEAEFWNWTLQNEDLNTVLRACHKQPDNTTLCLSVIPCDSEVYYSRRGAGGSNRQTNKQRKKSTGACCSKNAFLIVCCLRVTRDLFFQVEACKEI